MSPIVSRSSRVTDAPVKSTDTVRLFVIGAIVSALGTMIGVVLVAIFAPTNTAAAIQIIGIGTPIMVGFMAAAQQAQSSAIDGRMTQLLHATGEKERFKGVIDGLQENPAVTVVKVKPPEHEEP